MKKPVKMVAQCFVEGGPYFDPRVTSWPLRIKPPIRIYEDGVIMDNFCSPYVRKANARELAEIVALAGHQF
jgi:hypothetical protein